MSKMPMPRKGGSSNKDSYPNMQKAYGSGCKSPSRMPIFQLPKNGHQSQWQKYQKQLQQQVYRDKNHPEVKFNPGESIGPLVPHSARMVSTSSDLQTQNKHMIEQSNHQPKHSCPQINLLTNKQHNQKIQDQNIEKNLGIFQKIKQTLFPQKQPNQPKRKGEAKEEQQAIIFFHQSSLPLYDPILFHKLYRSLLRNKYQDPRRVKLGMFGKYYCSGLLGGPACKCCNGTCGPINGQNCVKCMQMDMLRRGLKKGQLVNADGAICWINKNLREEKLFSCGNMIGKDKGLCGGNITICYACNQLNTNIKRYSQLID